MTRVALALAVLLACGGVRASTGLESWRGFDVQIETLPESTHVNGLPLLIHRATGKGVTKLMEAMRRKWIQESGALSVRTERTGDWVVLSRMQAGSIELLQWRGSGRTAELIWSNSNFRTKIQAAPISVVTLPPGCVIGRTVHGDIDDRAYLQRTAHCTSAPRAILSSIGTNARRQGYAIKENGRLLVAHRRSTEVVVLVSPYTSGSMRETELVYLQVVREKSTP